jgi:predicted RNA-binding protein with PIN domain
MPYWFDGNNLIGLSVSQARGDRQTRRGFLSALSGYARTRGGRFTVFFDGDDPDRSIPPPGVQVHYSAPLSTDETIVRRLEAVRAPGEVIVVTNDRPFQAACKAKGAKVLDWNGFLSRMKSSFTERDPIPSREESVDMEEWLRYFGLDERS